MNKDTTPSRKAANARPARFRILARLDGNRAQSGTVTVERAADMFAVRPLRRRRVYALPLSVVAQMVVERVIRAEVLQRRAEKRARKTARS
jgi:hypothetical protein